MPVWVALCTASDWRWMHEREDSPWYPTVRLFRQRRCGEWAEVLQRMAAELEARPPLESAERYGQRGLAQLKEGKAAEAASALQRALELDPKNAVLHNNLGVALDQLGKKDEALASFQAAARLKPDYADARHNLGNRLRRANRMAEAEVEYRKALKALPESADLCNHLGITLLGQAIHGEAELRIKPDSPDTHKNLALAWLLRGDYLRGWREYEWRWKSPAAQARSFTQPRYDGRALDGEAVLLLAEQGLGDTIQFARYARLVKQRGGATLVECPGELVRLFARCPWIDRVIPSGSPLPEFAFQLPLMSAPAVFCTTVETVPADVPYLSADPALIEKWGMELVGHAAGMSGVGQAGSPPHGIRVGIAWQGSQKYAGDVHRSAPLQAFAPLAAMPGVQLIGLQKGYGSEQLRQVGDWNVLDLGNRFGDFADTAALMMHLDVVVSVDTSVAHLAGALGVPVWLALSTAADWRWLECREDSLWYPSARLFRQKQWGDWGEVFERIAGALRPAQVASHTPIFAEIAPGELLDRIANLETRRGQVRDEWPLDNLRRELGGLVAARARCLQPSSGKNW